MIKTKTSCYFEVKVVAAVADDSGTVKNKNLTYIVEAFSFTEAETVINKEFDGETFAVKSIRVCPFAEIIFDDEFAQELWYKVTVKYVTLDETTGKQKTTQALFLVNADNIDEAKSAATSIQGSLSEYYVSTIIETPIVEVKLHE